MGQTQGESGRRRQKGQAVGRLGRRVEREKVGGDNGVKRKEHTTANHKQPLATNTPQQQYSEGYTHKTPQTLLCCTVVFYEARHKEQQECGSCACGHSVHNLLLYLLSFFLKKSHALSLSVDTDRCQRFAFFVHARRERVVRCREGGNKYVSSNSHLLLHILTTLSSVSHAQKLGATVRGVDIQS